MSPAVVWTGIIHVAVGLALFSYKVLGLELALVPTNPEGVWQVELALSVRGTGAGALKAALPSNEASQIVFDETASSDGLSLSIENEGPGRIGVWSGDLKGIHRIVYSFRARLTERDAERPLPHAPFESDVPAPVARRYQEPTTIFPAAARPVRELLEELDVPPPDDPSGRLRTLVAFIEHRVATVSDGPADALLCLAEREGSPQGKSRLLVTLLRAADLPARLVVGLQLEEAKTPDLVRWVEVWIDGGWFPVSPVGDFFGARPRDLLALRYGPGDLVDGINAAATDLRYSALKERLGPQELANMMIPDNTLFASLSLYRLPLPAQRALRVLLLLPLGALAIALFRNFVGLGTFGTFLPILLGLALRETQLVLGLAMLAVVVLLGVVTRRFLEGLRLLLVPRLSFLLCVVILCVVGLALIGDGFGTRDFFAGVVFPIVVLTMLVERFSLVMAEEGFQEALRRWVNTLAVAVASYPLFKSTTAEHLMFGFPELVLVVMGLLVFIGGYSGFRLTDLVRFRLLGSSSETIPLASLEYPAGSSRQALDGKVSGSGS
jgi:hypothetical protein